MCLPEPVLAGECSHPSRIRRRFRPFIEDVDDRLPDLIWVCGSCQTNPLSKGLFSDMAVHLNGTRLQGLQFRGERTSARFHSEYGPTHRISNQTSRGEIPILSPKWPAHGTHPTE